MTRAWWTVAAAVGAIVAVIVLVNAGDDPADASDTSSSIVTTTALTTTTGNATTTTTSSTPTTTTTTPASTTTVPADNRAPSVTITDPDHLSYHEASYQPTTGRFGAMITFSASATDPDGDPVTVAWFSSQEGYLGTGQVINAIIHTENSDSAQPFITARAWDKWLATTTDVIQIIVWIPSGG